LVLLALVVLALVTALFVKKDYTVEREVTINKPKTQVFEYVKYLKNQNDYSKWAKMDPGMKKDFKGTDGTPGFISSWKSNRDSVGQGEQEIKKITEGQRIDYEIRFIEPWQSVAQSFMSTDSLAENQTKVKWNFNGHMPYPMNLMCLFMNMDKMIGDDLQTGLNNLKNIQEK